jgi:hypothetical protein
MNKVPAILGILFLAVTFLAIYIKSGAKKKRGPTGSSHFGWALLFLASGRMPPPPPETQIEAEANTEKDRSSSNPLRQPANIRSSPRDERHS